MSVAPAAHAEAGRPESGAAGARVGRLFADHGRMVYGLCRMLLRDPVEAEDAAQEVFLSAHRSILGGTVPREPAAWLATIARNECRARAHARMRAPLGLPEELEHTTDGVHEQAVRRQDMSALRAELERLPDRQREAVVLRDLYGLRYEEVGAALGLSRPSVEALLFRGRRRLQVRLADLRAGVGILAVPVSLRHGLARSVPGFTQAATAGAGTAAGGGGIAVIAKLAAAPLAAKLAIGTVAATVVGTAGFVAAEHRTPTPHRAPTVGAPASAVPTATTAATVSLVASRPAPRHAVAGRPRAARNLVTQAPTRPAVGAAAAGEAAPSQGGSSAQTGGDRPAPPTDPTTSPAGAAPPDGTGQSASPTGDGAPASGADQAGEKSAQGEGEGRPKQGGSQSSEGGQSQQSDGQSQSSDQQSQTSDQSSQPSDEQSQSSDQQPQLSDQQIQPSDQQQPQQPSGGDQQSSSGDGTSSSTLNVSSQSGDSTGGSSSGDSGSGGDSTDG